MEGLNIVTKKINVKKYTRTSKKGKKHKVTKHKRKKRKLGKKIKYKTVGKFQVAHDNLGNFRGSRIIKFKKLTSKSKPKKVKPLKLKIKKSKKSKNKKKRKKSLKKSKKRKLRKSRRKRPSVKMSDLIISPEDMIKNLDTQYYLGNVDQGTWLEARRNITG